ncbi:MAG: ADP-glyceromanno-heptose 6-epimerase [Campylobacterales bacterium]|nr:ADP-glyceromanno-heptose 6-epimerase [Campylobacterales bacterium]
MKYIQEDLNNKTILITGGAGFIGSNVAFHIQDNYPDAKIVVFDAFVLGHFKNLRGFRGEVISGDIANKDDLERLKKYKFDYIFHQGAISDTTVQDQKLVVNVNTNTLTDLLDMALEMGTKSFVYASSAGTYGNSPAPNRVGEGEVPENVYGFSKLMMDNIAYDYMKKHPEMNIVGLRYFNVFGPREVYKGKTASMILQLSLQMLAGQQPKLFKWGEQKRDFVYIEDVVQGNLKAIEPKKSGVYNIGSGKAREFGHIFGFLTTPGTLFEEETGLKPEYVDNPWAFYQNHTEADIEATKEGLGYEPRFGLEEGITAYLPEIKRIYNEEIK